MMHSRHGFRQSLRRAKAWVAAAISVIVFTALGAPNVQAQTPLTTRELRRIIGNPNGLRGIRYNQAVGLTFQKFVLAHMPGPKMSFANTKPYPSPVRTASTRNRLRSVIPDGVAGASIGSNSPLGATVTTYPESTFIEVKAVKGKITRSYGQYQIEGMLDVLSRSQAASSMGSSRAYPSLYFVITGDTSIAPDVTQEATRLKILVWLSYVTVFPDDRLQVAAPTCLNCAHIFIGPGTPGVVIPGLTFRLGAPGISVPVLFDPPILDDGLIGHPGLPGLTAPNP